MSESSRNKPTSRGVPSKFADSGSATSIPRTAAAAVLAALGIAWIVVYLNIAVDSTSGAMAWMGDLGRWNFLIGFVLIFLGLAVAANKATPLGRGRGVVVGMLGCFLIGLIWIVVYYVAGSRPIPLLQNLGQYNLIVGIGFMAVGFVFATKWE